MADSSDSSESEEGGGELREEVDPSEEQERRRTAMTIGGKVRYCPSRNNSAVKVDTAILYSPVKR